MDRPVQFLLTASMAVLLMPCAVSAADGDGVMKRERVISPRMAEVLAAQMPKYEAVVARAKETTPVLREGAGNEVGKTGDVESPIVTLPNYIVREGMVPKTEDIMTTAAKEKLAMQKYLGDEDGLERSLNMISVAGLWKKIPVLGGFPFIVGQYNKGSTGPALGPRTNEQRALDRYQGEKWAERWKDLHGLLAPELKAGGGTGTSAEAAKKKK